MGQKGSSQSSLKKKDLDGIQKSTHFESDEIVALFEHFCSVAATKTGKVSDDIHQKIDRNLFLSSIGSSKGSLFLDRMFTLFDKDRDGFITFTDYVNGLSVLCARGTLDEKVRFAFEIYDYDNDGKISKDELGDMLMKSLLENEVKLSGKQVKSIIDATFTEADKNKDGFIDIHEFKAMTDNHRSILNNMTLDFKGIIDARRHES